MGSFPFHTDAAHWRIPPSIILLYCDSTGSGRRGTLITDSQTWQLSEHEWCLMFSGVWRSGYVRPFLCTLAFRGIDGTPRLRYDPGCMIPVSRTAIEVAKSIKEYLSKGRQVRLDWNEGDLLVLDNTRVLHARGAAAEPDYDRVLARVLIGGNYEDVAFRATMAKGQDSHR